MNELVTILPINWKFYSIIVMKDWQVPIGFQVSSYTLVNLML